MKTKTFINESMFLHTGKSNLAISYKKWLTFFLLIILGSGCKKATEEAGIQGLCPEVISTSPEHLATGVAFNTLIRAKFNEPVNGTTITSTSFTVKQGTNVVTGTVSYADSTATFTPAVILTPGIYTATISAGINDMAGNAMINDYTWSFTTVPDITAPTVTSTVPENLATGVPLNSMVTATFSEPMNASTVISSFAVKLGITTVAGSVTYTGTTATFTPTASLMAGKIYTGIITTGAKDMAGNGLAVDHTWSFTTVQPVVPPPVAIGSTIALFGVFGGSAGVTNKGLNTVINNGGLGTTGASTLITGFHDGITTVSYTETPLDSGNVKGGIFTAPPIPGTAASFLIATNALTEAVSAFNSLSPASKPGGVDPGAGELGGLTLPPGIYKSAGGSFAITNGNLTLDANSDPNAVWIFQTGTSLTVGIAGPTGARSVNLINGAQAKNVFWHIGSAATINGAGGGIMAGNIFSSAGVTFSTAGNAVQTVLNGRAVSLNASVTMVNTTINVP